MVGIVAVHGDGTALRSGHGRSSQRRCSAARAPGGSSRWPSSVASQPQAVRSSMMVSGAPPLVDEVEDVLDRRALGHPAEVDALARRRGGAAARRSGRGRTRRARARPRQRRAGGRTADTRASSHRCHRWPRIDTRATDPPPPQPIQQEKRHAPTTPIPLIGGDGGGDPCSSVVRVHRSRQDRDGAHRTARAAAIFIGSAISVAPAAGTRSRLARFSNPGLLAPLMTWWTMKSVDGP